MLAKRGSARVTRDQPAEDEGNQQYAEQNRNGKKNTAGDILQHTL
jgi:hypothetical protein